MSDRLSQNGNTRPPARHGEQDRVHQSGERAETSTTDIDLPPPDTKRWVIRRKAAVVAGVREGLITMEDACARYSLSIDEFLSWKHRLEASGISGLRVTVSSDLTKH